MDASLARLLMEETRSRATKSIDETLGPGAHLIVSSLTVMLIREVLAKFGLQLRVIACNARAVAGDIGNAPEAEDKEHLILVGSGFYMAPLLDRIGSLKSGTKGAFLAGRFPAGHQSDAPFRVRNADTVITFTPKEDQVSWLYSQDLDPRKIAPLVRKVIEEIAA